MEVVFPTPDALRRALRLADRRVTGGLARMAPVASGTGLAALQALPWLIGRRVSLGTLAQLHGAADRDRPAVLDDRGTLSWSTLDDRINRLAGALTMAGVAPGSTVATLLRNGREQVEAILATQKLGATVQLLNTWARPRQLLQTFVQELPQVLVYDVRHGAQLPDPLHGVELIAVGDGEEALARSIRYEEALAMSSPHQPPPFTLHRGRPRIVVQTSGTTGRAKGAARRAATQEGLALLGLLSVVPFARHDVIVCPAPLFHSFGLLVLGVSCSLGATLVLPDRFDPKPVLELSERHQATAVALVPVMLRGILSLPGKARSGARVPSLRIILTSGSALTEDLHREATRLFGDVLYDLYGSTEAGWVAVATPEDSAAAPRTVGRPVPGVEVAILDQRGNRCPPGVSGAISVRSHAAFEGYLASASWSERPDRHGWLPTGDLGHVDESGRLFVEGRADDMVVVGGENVYPAEVEEVIEELPGVEQAAVVGVPDARLGRALVAYVQARRGSGVDRGAVLARCREELPSFKVPREVHVVRALPRTATGKVIKPELPSA